MPQPYAIFVLMRLDFLSVLYPLRKVCDNSINAPVLKTCNVPRVIHGIDKNLYSSSLECFDKSKVQRIHADTHMSRLCNKCKSGGVHRYTFK